MSPSPIEPVAFRSMVEPSLSLRAARIRARTITVDVPHALAAGGRAQAVNRALIFAQGAAQIDFPIVDDVEELELGWRVTVRETGS